MELSPSFKILFIYWLCWSVLLHGLFLSCGKWAPLSGCSALASHCCGFFVVEHRLQGTGLAVVVAHELSCPTVCGIFLDQGSSPHLLHWQMDSLPLSHQGSPVFYSFKTICILKIRIIHVYYSLLLLKINYDFQRLRRIF